MTRPGFFQGRPRTVSVWIPSRYVLRASRANRVIWILLTPAALFLFGYCLLGLAVMAFDVLRAGLFFGGAVFLVLLFCVLTLLLFAALMLACPLLAVKSRKDSLTVDGEQLVLRRWLRKPVSFAFTDIAFVRMRKSRETVLLQGREGQVLCRLSAVMEHMDILQADLRSRRVPFVERNGPIANAFILSPGPRREEITLTLPDAVPGYYRLTYPPVFTGIFAVLLVLCLGLILFFGLGLRELGVLAFLPFALLAVVGLVWVKMERTEIIGGRIRHRNPLGRVTECAFDGVAAVRVSTTVSGIGSMSSVQLLAADGSVLLHPGLWFSGAYLLLADLIDRGVPFTY